MMIISKVKLPVSVHKLPQGILYYQIDNPQCKAS